MKTWKVYVRLVGKDGSIGSLELYPSIEAETREEAYKAASLLCKLDHPHESVIEKPWAPGVHLIRKFKQPDGSTKLARPDNSINWYVEEADDGEEDEDVAGDGDGLPAQAGRSV